MTTRSAGTLYTSSSPHQRNTRARPSMMSSEPDHPRACGEHRTSAAFDPNTSGSSLHQRGALAATSPTGGATSDHPRISAGAHVGGVLANQDRWIIPASAGSTSRRVMTGRATPDHPRVSGDHDRDFRTQVRQIGSPAPAGSTSLRTPTILLPTDHPRASGEHESARNAGRTCRGSSPRQRGAPCCRSRRRYSSGSSPRQRGARILVVVHGAQGRIIPASAGSTLVDQRESTAVRRFGICLHAKAGSTTLPLVTTR
jgi:hypothetical protein